MGETKRFENLERALCKELEKLDHKYASNAEMTEQDAERARTLYHALKSAETYHAMKEAGEYNGMSETRGRSPYTGRYISRDYPEHPYYGRYPMMGYMDPYMDDRR